MSQSDNKYVIDVEQHSIANQKKYINRIISLLEENNIKSKLKSSRATYPNQVSSKIPSLLIEIEDNVDNVKNIFSILDIDAIVADLESYAINRQISGMYHSYHIKIKKSGKTTDPVIKNGSEFYVTASSKSTSTIRTKSLAPKTLGLEGKYRSVEDYDRSVENVLSTISGVGENNVAFMKNMYELSKNISGTISSTPSKGGTAKIISETVSFTDNQKKLYSSVKSGDVNTIGKDFGEVISLRWVLNHSPYSNFEYFELPVASNEPLVDYFVMIKTKKYGKIRIEFSAKYAAGASPSLQSVLSKIDKTFPSPKGSLKNKIDVLKIFTNPGVNQNILDAIKILNSPAYNELKRAIGAQNKRSITVGDLQSYITKEISSKTNTKSRISAFFQSFDPYFDALGKKIGYDGRSKVTYDRIFGSSSNPQSYSPVLFTTGSKIVEMMNADKEYQDILNTVARDIDVIQVYLEFFKDKLTFHMQEFGESEFKFDYRANMSNSGNTGLRFSMIKKSKAPQTKEFK